MFATDEAIDVTLLCDDIVMKSVVDKFGMDIDIKTAGKNRFRVNVKVCVSPTFYSWILVPVEK